MDFGFLSEKLEVAAEADGRDCRSAAVVLEAVVKQAARGRCRGERCTKRSDARMGGTVIGMKTEKRIQHP